MDFKDWFIKLIEIEESKHYLGIIHRDKPEEYYDYYEDGDSPRACFFAEFLAAQKEQRRQHVIPIVKGSESILH